MSKIPIRDIIIGVNVAETTRKDEENEKQYNYTSSVKRINGKKPSKKLYIILIALNLIGFFIVLPLINMSIERKEIEVLVKTEEFVAEKMVNYKFNLENADIWSETQGFTSINMSYDFGYYGSESNSIRITYEGVSYPRDGIGGISFMSIYYDKEGKSVDGCYLRNDICKRGDVIKFTDSVFDLAPGEYSVKIFASDSPERPMSLPKKR